jgi:localization factor PodJL
MASHPSYRPDEFGRVAVALDRLTDRIEASETRTGLAISGVEHSVRHAMARIEAAEREHMAVAARVDAAAERIDAEQARVAERLRGLEGGPRSDEALRALASLESRVAHTEAVGGEPLIEAVVSRLGERLSLAESRTGEALEGLRSSLAELDRRMGSGERGDIEQRFEALAAQLTRRVEDARVEIAERLAATAPGQVEARLGEMAERLAGAEQRSARAIEAMGREVLAMAETLNRRVQSAEQRAAQAIEQVGGEIARIAGAVESRLGRTDQLHAEALERLGGEIARITERLTDRIIQSERRAAQAIDDVGDQVSKVTERIEKRHERASSDLAERIRQSEARTAKMLEEAQLGQPARHEPLAQDPEFKPADLEPGDRSAAAREMDTPAPAGGLHTTPIGAAAIFGAELMSRAEPLSQPALDPGHPTFAAEDFEAADRFAPIPETDDEPIAAVDAAAEASGLLSDEAPKPLSTREVIEQARAAARAATANRMKTTGPAERRARSPRPSLFSALKPGRPTSTWQTALMVAGGAAFLSVGAAGVVLLEGPRVDREAAIELPFGYAPRAAVALSAPEAAPEPVAAPADVEPSSADFASAAKAIEKGAPGGLAKMKAIAEADYAPAQLFLARLYENGSAGVKTNLAEARRWTARAAEGGDPAAMHNLALYFFHGDGGVRDTAQAAQWFRKAAERGVMDSQYNLALLYQSGSGAPRDLAQAYKWFQIAANNGDGAARAAAVDLEPKLTGVQIAAAQAAADRFRPAAESHADSPVQAAPQAAVSVVAAQRILGRLGYYKGRADGTVSRDLKLAVSAYQHDQGLAATGSLDPATASRLSVFTR